MRKRSSYRPKGVNPTAHLMAMMGASLMSTDDALKRAELLRLAIEEACKGSATRDDWRLVFDCVNVVEQLARHRVVHGVDVIEALQDALETIHARQRNTGTRALYAGEIVQLRGFAADYAEILSGVTQQQYVLAQRGVEDRIRRILSTEKIPASLRVVEAT